MMLFVEEMRKVATAPSVRLEMGLAGGGARRKVKSLGDRPSTDGDTPGASPAELFLNPEEPSQQSCAACWEPQRRGISVVLVLGLPLSISVYQILCFPVFA